MEIIIIGIVEDVKSFMGKNGFGANVTLSQLVNKRRKTITFNVTDKAIADTLEDKLQEEITLKILLEQNNFGLRLGSVIEIA